MTSQMRDNLEDLSIADLKAVRDYVLYQSEARPFEFERWAKIGRDTIEVLEERIKRYFPS